MHSLRTGLVRVHRIDAVGQGGQIPVERAALGVAFPLDMTFITFPEQPMRSMSVLLVMGMLVGGCGDGAAGGGARVAPVVRDSAGITIVENTAPLWREGQEWRISDGPVLEIGMLDGPEEYQFDQVRHVARLTEGRIAVADGGSQRIRLYDADGRHVRDLGARGGGPGEFEGLTLVRPFRGDSVAAWDGRHKRLTVFDGSERVGRVWTVEGLDGMMAPAVGWFADGSIVVTPGMNPMQLATAEPGERRETRRYLRADPAGGVDTVATILGRDELVYHQAASFGTRTVLFGREAYAAVHGDRFVAGESGRFEITVRETGGALRQIARVRTEPRPVTAAELAAARERELEERRTSARQIAQQLGRAVEEDRSELPARATHPFFDSLAMDASGHVWLREPSADEDVPRRWQVFDPEGRWLGSIETPAGLRVTEIGDDYVIGVHRDEYEVEYVRVHALVRANPRR